ncbi:MAG: hypothetical protein SH868_04420 [Bythopirellula sp.]|nr:hypothetical protein [Bythopirellula sp.]
MTQQTPSCQQTPSWLSCGSESSLVACAMILILALLGFTLLCLPLAFWLGGNSVTALLAATGVCITPGLAALAISHHFSATGQPLPGMLLAMGCRLLPPLVVCLWLALNQSAAQGQVFAGFLIVAYLVSLAVETYLSVRSIGPQHQLSSETK